MTSFCFIFPDNFQGLNVKAQKYYISVAFYKENNIVCLI